MDDYNKFIDCDGRVRGLSAIAGIDPPSVGQTIRGHKLRGYTQLPLRQLSLRGYICIPVEWLDRMNGFRAAVTAMSKSANSENIWQLFPKGPPEDSDLVDVVVRLDAAKGSAASDNEIARKYTGESKDSFPKAQKILARIRMGKKRGKINL